MVRVVQKKGSAKRQKEKSEKTKRVLKVMRQASEEERAQRLSVSLRLPYIDLHIVPLHADDVRSIPLEDAKRLSVGIFFRRGKQVRVGMADPADAEALAYVKNLFDEKGWTTEIYVISRSSLEKIFQAYYKTTLIDHLDHLKFEMTENDLAAFENRFKEVLALRDRIDELPTSEIMTLIFAGAIKLGASDVHFEPREKEVRMRYRLDGVLQDVGMFPTHAYKLLVSRIKMLGSMKLNVRNRAQDGHFSLHIQTKKEGDRVDVRVGIIPSRYGEGVVMRILHQGTILLKVEDLGLRGKVYEAVLKQAQKTNGMILTTGPTGSGKTTTLYAFINTLNTPERKIITIENPIEYEIEGISQTEVSQKGYTFARGLQAIVRQDPDIILVGEIRDDETADIALNASITGHLVLSTLHTNSAVDTIVRLVELGVKPSLIGPAVNVAIAQRLVRRLCLACRQEYVPAKQTAEMLQKILAVISPKAGVSVPKKIEKLYRSVGCDSCNRLGYKGQIGIFEALVIDDDIQSMIEDMKTTGDILHEAMEGGMITMAQDGILKAINGETSIEEVWRVAGQVDFLESLYEDLMEQTLGRALSLSSETLKATQKNAQSREVFSEYIKTLPSDRIVEALFTGALFFNAGDIYIEPEQERVRVRFRIDGILQDVGSFTLTEHPAVVGEIKTLAGLKSQDRLQVKDGRFSIELEQALGVAKDTHVDIRVSFLTGGYGETVVARLLNKSAVALDLENLGIRKENLARLQKQLKRPNGFFCNTGPTGSGKTTTLYSMLAKLNRSEVKIMTVEDPIEYRMNGVLQTQIDADKGYTFSTALKTLLRQNPDIIMVGEIRDAETAQIAAQAALTGHLVFSTLHTNDAVGSVQRLLNVGVRGDDLAELANGFMAQRLVRVLCTCKKKRKMTEEEQARIKTVFLGIAKKYQGQIPKVEYMYEPVGCASCKGIGYSGQTVISEVLTADDAIREAMSRQAMSAEIEKIAIEGGMITMLQDGALKIVEGVTSFSEIERVTEL